METYVPDNYYPINHVMTPTMIVLKCSAVALGKLRADLFMY